MSENSVKISHSELRVQQVIDTCGTRCPLPLLRAKQALKAMLPGELLKVLATDPAAKPDFDAMLRHLPHQLISYESHADTSGKYRNIDSFIIQKGEAEES